MIGVGFQFHNIILLICGRQFYFIISKYYFINLWSSIFEDAVTKRVIVCIITPIYHYLSKWMMKLHWQSPGIIYIFIDNNSLYNTFGVSGGSCSSGDPGRALIVKVYFTLVSPELNKRYKHVYYSLCQLHRSVGHDRCKLWRFPFMWW